MNKVKVLPQWRRYTKARKKVPIIIEIERYSKGVKNEATFISVSYGAYNYGGAAPCDNQAEMEVAIERARKTILEQDDVPIEEAEIGKQEIGSGSP